MSKLIALLFALALAACAKEPVPVPMNWATTVAVEPRHVPPECRQTQKVTEPKATTVHGLLRDTDAVLNDFAKLKAKHEACGAWAERQSK